MTAGSELQTTLKFRSLVEALEAAPPGRPFVTAWIAEDEEETISFGEFRRRARVQAEVLRRHGVRDGDRVVIIMQGIAAMAAFVGAMMLNAVPAFVAYPNFKIDPAKYQHGLSGMTANLRARAVIIDDSFPDQMLCYIEQCSVIRLRTGDHCNEDLGEVRQPAPGNLAFIQHSAGTTGLQKGVALTHALVLRHIDHLQHRLGIEEERDRIYSWLPLYHDMGLIACFMLPMVCHLPVVMQSPLDWVMHPESMLHIISDYKCTMAWLPNFGFQFLARRIRPARRSRFDLSSMRALINCSEPVREASMREFEEAFRPVGLQPGALQSCYAMAENVFAVSQTDLRSKAGPRRIFVNAQKFRAEHCIVADPYNNCGETLCFVSSGRLLDNTQLRILSDFGKFLPDGHVGEVLIKSDTLFEGYYNRPDLTAKAIVDGWYHSGDLGFTFDSELYVVGRKKDLLIVGGENLYPQDIEEVISDHPSVHDGRVVAFGVYNPELGTEEVVVVAEVHNKEFLADAAVIENDLRERIVLNSGICVRVILLKPPKWIVKSTAGKPARAATREKLLREHPEIGIEP